MVIMRIKESAPHLKQDRTTVWAEAAGSLLSPVLDPETSSEKCRSTGQPGFSSLHRESARMREKAPAPREALSSRKQEVGELVLATAPEPENLPDTSRALEPCPSLLKRHRHGQWPSSSHPRWCPLPGAHQQGERIQPTPSNTHLLWGSLWRPKQGEKVFISSKHAYIYASITSAVNLSPVEFCI